MVEPALYQISRKISDKETIFIDISIGKLHEDGNTFQSAEAATRGVL